LIRCQAWRSAAGWPVGAGELVAPVDRCKFAVAAGRTAAGGGAEKTAELRLGAAALGRPPAVGARHGDEAALRILLARVGEINAEI